MLFSGSFTIVSKKVRNKSISNMLVWKISLINFFKCWKIDCIIAWELASFLPIFWSGMLINKLHFKFWKCIAQNYNAQKVIFFIKFLVFTCSKQMRKHLGIRYVWHRFLEGNILFKLYNTYCTALTFTNWKVLMSHLSKVKADLKQYGIQVNASCSGSAVDDLLWYVLFCYKS